jgi:hypothetical protein
VQEPIPQVAVHAPHLTSIHICPTADEDAAAEQAAEAAGKKKRPAARVYTKREREDALMVHRAHCMCLLGHALLHDTAAADQELQVCVELYMC